MRTPSPPRAAIERRFRDLHAETYADLVRFVERRSFGNDAEDVVSAVFMTAWRRIDNMPEDARPWLFGIARKQMQNAARGAARQRDLDVAIAAHADSTVADTAQASSARIDFVRAWHRLEPRDRETLALVAFDGLNADQAATVLGCRRSTFTMRLTRARRRLRDALDETSDHGAVPHTQPDLEAITWNA
jgi:RNA polymerase sigma-70 factor (ECF subfamily)